MITRTNTVLAPLADFSAERCCMIDGILLRVAIGQTIGVNFFIALTPF